MINEVVFCFLGVLRITVRKGREFICKCCLITAGKSYALTCGVLK